MWSPLECAVPIVSLYVVIFTGASDAFQCQSCAYSYSPEHPDTDMACVYQPEVYTGWSVLKCADFCVVQEIYNKNLQRVVSYWRSCSDKAESEYCREDDMLLTCFYSCQGDMCNSWVRGQLHVDFGNIRNPSNGANSLNAAAWVKGSQASSKILSWISLSFILMWVMV